MTKVIFLKQYMHNQRPVGRGMAGQLPDELAAQLIADGTCALLTDVENRKVILE